MIKSINTKLSRTLLLLLSFAMLFFITACGGSLDDETDTDTPTGSGLQIALSASASTLSAGQSTVVTAKVTDSLGAAVQSKTINFACSGGSCPSGGTITAVNGGVTDAGGQAVAIYKAGTATSALSLQDTITATSGKSSALLVITRTASTGTTYQFTMSAGSTSLSAGQSTVISVAITDGTGAPVQGQTVTFTKEIPSSAPTLTTLGTGVTDASGKVQAIYTAGSANPTADVQDTISASISGGAAYAVVIITRKGTTTSGAATSGYSMSVTADPITAAAGDHSIITATVVDSEDNPVSGMSVTFAFLPSSSIGSTLSTTSGSTDASGSFTTIYTAGTGGTGAVQDVIQTTVTGVGCNTSCPTCGYSTTAAVLVTRTTASGTSSGIRVDLTAAPYSVAAEGQSVLTATVLDGTSNPVLGATVNFGFINNTTGASLRDSNQTTPGLTAVTGTTDANGQAVAIYTTGVNNAGFSMQDTVNVNAIMGANNSSDAVIITRTGTSGGSTVTAARIYLEASPTTIRTDGSLYSTITVSALNASNALLSGVVVTLSTDTGILSSPTVTTNADTPATVRLYCGPNKANRTAIVTATAGAVTAAPLPILITGSTVTVSASTSSISIGSVSNLTVTVTDFGGNAISGANVTLSQSSGDGGSVTLGATSGPTNGSGIFSTTATGLTQGTATITATWQGTEGTTPIIITATGLAFGIENQYLDGSPTAVPLNPDPTTVSINASGTPYTPHSLKLVVNAPGVTTVRFATTIGSWNSTTNKVIDVPVGTTGDGAGKVSATLTSTNIGIANVQVSNTANPAVNDTLTVAMSSGEPPNKIFLQASSTVVPVSVGTTTYTSTLTATVYDSSNNPLVGQPVAFEIVNGTSTSGGETISPVIVMTNFSGQAIATFNSGSMPTAGSGVQIRASVVGTLIETEPIGINTTDSGNDVAIVIGGTAGSIAFGWDSKAGQDSTNANYTYKMSVLVADANGNPVAGAVVNLGAWPIAWSDGLGCIPTQFYLNEDNTYDATKENMILDTLEDGRRIEFDMYNPPTYASANPPVVGTLDSRLTPVNSAGGTVPASVTTDENGVAGFTLTYPKSSGMWIYDRIRATTMVQGTETRADTLVYLKIVVGEEVICAESPFRN